MNDLEDISKQEGSNNACLGEVWRTHPEDPSVAQDLPFNKIVATNNATIS
jgi:hypothetical protein